MMIERIQLLNNNGYFLYKITMVERLERKKNQLLLSKKNIRID